MKFAMSGRQRLTDCCGVYSTYFQTDLDEHLVCKKCYHPVGNGQGDGTDFLAGDDVTVMSDNVNHEVDLKAKTVTRVQVEPTKLYDAENVQWVII